jgi:hypothetical protein
MKTPNTNLQRPEKFQVPMNAIPYHTEKGKKAAT